MNLSRDTCLRALDARDPRFDGVFYVGVTSTGIYCRPVCPAPPPRRDRCQFFSNAAAAERRGFRPCLRCRPELAPGNASIDAAERVARRASARIAEGALNGRSVDDLAAEFGITARQLRRVIEQQTGVSPVELAQTHRLLLAKRLLTDTRLPMTQVAFASGFQSVRRFDALFQERYRLTPSALRRKTIADSNERVDTVSLTLGYRPPLDWQRLLAFFAARATPGVEYVEGDCYARTITLNGMHGWVRVEPTKAPRKTPQRFADRRSLRVEIPASLTPVLMPLMARLRQLFDLDADPVVIEQQLAERGLEQLVRARPGLRVPGSMDGFDLALRAVLGQQVSVKGATTIAGRFAERFGDAFETPDERLRFSTPTAARVAAATIAELKGLGITTSRAATVLALARAMVGDGRTFGDGLRSGVRGGRTFGDGLRSCVGDVPGDGRTFGDGLRNCVGDVPGDGRTFGDGLRRRVGDVPGDGRTFGDGLRNCVGDGEMASDASSRTSGAERVRRLLLEPNVDVTRTMAALTAIPGIGDWTAQYIAMRALRWPDGFPASDLWLRRAAGGLTTAKLIKRSEQWRPWRAYAAMHLWNSTND